MEEVVERNVAKKVKKYVEVPVMQKIVKYVDIPRDRIVENVIEVSFHFISFHLSIESTSTDGID